MGVHTISLWNCNKITDIGLEHLKGVHTINLWGYSKITDVGKDILRKANPQVIIYQ